MAVHDSRTSEGVVGIQKGSGPAWVQSRSRARNLRLSQFRLEWGQETFSWPEAKIHHQDQVQKLAQACPQISWYENQRELRFLAMEGYSLQKGAGHYDAMAPKIHMWRA